MFLFNFTRDALLMASNIMPHNPTSMNYLEINQLINGS